MPEYRRIFRPGGTYFFTLVTFDRARILCTDVARAILRTAICQCREEFQFTIDAFVLLPDHLHTVWTLPPGDSAYSKRWAMIKREFSEGWLAGGGAEGRVTVNQRQQRRRGVWQPRFWEHTARDENDRDRHFDYIHYNPMKHGLVQRLSDWPYSSFHRFVREGCYPPDWGGDIDPAGWDDIAGSCGE